MFTKEELAKMPEFWMENIQNELYLALKTYMKQHKLNQTELATKLGFTKGYISQVLHGNFNHSLQKFIELSLAIDKAPNVQLENLAQYIKNLDDRHELKIVHSINVTSSSFETYDQLALVG